MRKMKKLVFALLAMVIMVSCSTPEQFVLKGTLEGSTDEVVFLQKREAGKMIKLDSVAVENGSFEFAPGNVDFPEMYYLSIDGKRGNASFFIENSEITFSGHVDTLYNLSVAGSATQTEYDDYNALLEPFYEKNMEIYQAARDASEAGDEEKAAELNEKRTALFDEISEFQSNFVKSNPASFITPVILQSISYSMETSELDASLNSLDESLSVSQIVIDLKVRVEALKLVDIGKIAPDFTQNDVDGNPVTLSELKGHKLLLIDFWAAWCGPCRAENPNVVAVYNEFHEKGFDVLGVSLDREKEAWVKAIADDNLTWTQVSDLAYWSNAAAKLYAVNSIPANLLIDAEGKILAKGLRGEKLREKIAELLAE